RRQQRSSPFFRRCIPRGNFPHRMPHAEKFSAMARSRRKEFMPHHHSVAWQFPVWFTVTIVFTSVMYLRGWIRVRSSGWRAGSFLIGMFLIWVAVASRLAALDHEFLTVHMIQHLLLMTFAAPLILLGEPMMLVLKGVRRTESTSESS